MLGSNLFRIFISYSRKDGVGLATRLRGDLQKYGFDAWLDVDRIPGSAVWTTEIEDPLHSSQVVLALLTTGSYRSKICPAEQLRALRTEKCVIPVLGQTGTDVPLHLEAKQYRNLATKDYSAKYEILL